MKERIDAFVAGGMTLPILTLIVPPDQLGDDDRRAGSLARPRLRSSLVSLWATSDEHAVTNRVTRARLRA